MIASPWSEGEGPAPSDMRVLLRSDPAERMFQIETGPAPKQRALVLAVVQRPVENARAVALQGQRGIEPDASLVELACDMGPSIDCARILSQASEPDPERDGPSFEFGNP